MRMGYTGKQVIHPGQVPIVQEAFLPTKSQIEWAEGLLNSFEQHQKTGKVLKFSLTIMCSTFICFRGHLRIGGV